MRSLFVRILLWYGLIVSTGLAIFMLLAIISWDSVLRTAREQQSRRVGLFVAKSAQDLYRAHGREGLEGFSGNVARYMNYEVRLLSTREASETVDIATGAPVGLPGTPSDQTEEPIFYYPQNEIVCLIRLTPELIFYGKQATAGQPRRWINKREVRYFLIALTIAGLLCYLLARSLTRPIVALQQATHRLAGGDTGYRVELARNDELGALAEDFNRMAARIQELIGAREELLRRVSHELRSPLARLNVALELLRQSVTDSAPAQLAVTRCEQESARLNELIGQLLTFSRINAAAALTEVSVFDLEELTLDVAADINYEAEPLGCSVEVVESRPLTINGNRELLRSALENVLRNAIRYAPEQSTVTVALQRSGEGQAEIVITDRGPGVPAEKLEWIFEPFHRITTSEGQSTPQLLSGSAGLGLAIARRAVELHHGRISARNQDGGGLTITISLPFSQG